MKIKETDLFPSTSKAQQAALQKQSEQQTKTESAEVIVDVQKLLPSSIGLTYNVGGMMNSAAQDEKPKLH